MSIQISVTVWTIICFIALMIILKNLLFKPVLDIIDLRRQKVEAARQKKQQIIEQKIEQSRLIEQKKTEYSQQKIEAAKAEVEQINSEGKKRIEDARHERLARVDAYRCQADCDLTKIVDEASPDIIKASEIFAQKIVSHRI